MLQITASPRISNKSEKSMYSWSNGFILVVMAWYLYVSYMLLQDYQLCVETAFIHYNDVMMGAMASQVTSFTIVYLTFYSGADQRKCQSSASLAFVRGIHWWPVNSPRKWPVNVSIWWRHHDDGLSSHCRCIAWYFFTYIVNKFASADEGTINSFLIASVSITRLGIIILEYVYLIDFSMIEMLDVLNQSIWYQLRWKRWLLMALIAWD